MQTALLSRRLFLWCVHALAASLLALPAHALLPGERVVVLNSGDGTVSVIDRATRKVVDTFPVGKEPHHLIPNLKDDELVVANAISNDLVFLNPLTGEIKRRLPRISDP